MTIRLPKILEILGKFFTGKQFDNLMMNLLSLIRDDVRQIRRNTSKIIFYLFKYHHEGDIEMFCNNLIKTW